MTVGKDYIGVGCGAIIINDKNQVLLLKRANDSRIHPGMWSRPGGQIEFGESGASATEREIKEETGIIIKTVRSLDFTENISDDGSKHWISLGFLTEYISGEPKNIEPDKHDDIQWFPLDDLPSNLTDYTRNSIKVYLKTK